MEKFHVSIFDHEIVTIFTCSDIEYDDFQTHTR